MYRHLSCEERIAVATLAREGLSGAAIVGGWSAANPRSAASYGVTGAAGA